MALFDFKKLKDFASTINSKTSSHDERDTATRGLVSVVVKGAAKMLHKKYLSGMSKDTATVVAGLAVSAGYVFRKITNLGSFSDGVITDFAQEVADVVLDDSKEDLNGKSAKEVQDMRVRLIFIAKIFLNAGRIMDSGKTEKFFKDFNDLLAGLNETKQAQFVEALSKFDKKQLIDFMELSAEQKKRFFPHIFTNAPEPPKQQGFVEKSLEKLAEKTKFFFVELKKEINEYNDLLGKDSDDDDSSSNTAGTSSDAKEYYDKAKTRWAERKKAKDNKKEKSQQKREALRKNTVKGLKATLLFVPRMLKKLFLFLLHAVIYLSLLVWRMIEIIIPKLGTSFFFIVLMFKKSATFLARAEDSYN